MLHWVCGMYRLCLHFHSFRIFSNYSRSGPPASRSSGLQLPPPYFYRKVYNSRARVYPTVLRRTCFSLRASHVTPTRKSADQKQSASHERATSGSLSNAAVFVVKPTFSSGRTPLTFNYLNTTTNTYSQV